MNGFYPIDFDPNNDPKIGSNPNQVDDPTSIIDWGDSLNRELDKQRQVDRSFVPTPSPVYDPSTHMSSRRSTSTPRLTDDQIKKYINAKCWINGTYLNSMDTEYLVNCKNYATQRIYRKWYWKYFLNLVNEEIINRDVAIGPKRYYPGTEDIPRRGDYYNYGVQRYPIR